MTMMICLVYFDIDGPVEWNWNWDVPCVAFCISVLFDLLIFAWFMDSCFFSWGFGVFVGGASYTWRRSLYVLIWRGWWMCGFGFLYLNSIIEIRLFGWWLMVLGLFCFWNQWNEIGSEISLVFVLLIIVGMDMVGIFFTLWLGVLYRQKTCIMSDLSWIFIFELGVAGRAWLLKLPTWVDGWWLMMHGVFGFWWTNEMKLIVVSLCVMGGSHIACLSLYWCNCFFSSLYFE